MLPYVNSRVPMCFRKKMSAHLAKVKVKIATVCRIIYGVYDLSIHILMF